MTDGTDIITVQVRAKGGATTEAIVKVKYTSVENQNSVIISATVADFEQTVDEIAFELYVSLEDLESPVSY